VKRQNTIPEFVQSFTEDAASMKKLSDMFRLCDLDSDGKVQKDELRRMIDELGVQYSDPIEFETLFADLDTNGDGELSFGEFLHGMRWLQKGFRLSAPDISQEAVATDDASQLLRSVLLPVHAHTSTRATPTSVYPCVCVCVWVWVWVWVWVYAYLLRVLLYAHS
jgi:EF-hand domain pair